MAHVGKKLVKAREGRPIKIEGNELSRHSQGGVCAVGQSTVLNLYDAGRFMSPMAGGAAADWKKTDEQAVAALKSGGNVRRMRSM